MPSLTTSSLATLSFLVLTITCAPSTSSAQTTSNSATPSMIECASGHPLRVQASENLERVPSENPAVLCIFRNKFEGFPTLNIVVEPRHEGSPPPTLAEYEEGIRRGYHSVGLSDAKLSNSRIGSSDGVPFFTSTVSFTNAGTAMRAEILVLQLHDRTYTASAVGRGSPESTELQDLISGIEVEGRFVDLRGDTGGISRVIAMLLGVLAAIFTAALLRRRRGTR